MSQDTLKKGDEAYDTAYSWVLVSVLTLTYMMFAGTAKTFGVLYTELLEFYSAGAAKTAWIASVAFFLLMALGPLANHLCVVFSFRTVIMTGGILMSTGFMMTSQMPKIEWMYLSYGVVTGCAYGLLFSPSVTVVNYYIRERRALANGLIVSGSGLGIFIFPYLYRALINEYGLRGALMVLSGISLHVCIAGAMVRQPVQLKKKPKLENKLNVTSSDETHKFLNGTKKEMKNHENLIRQEDTTKPKSSCIASDSIFDMSILRNPSFTIITVSFVIHGLGFLCMLILLSPYTVSLGYSKVQADLIMSLAGVGEIVSRIFFGWLADKSIVSKTNLYLMCTLISGVATIAVSFVEWYPGLVIYAIIVGIFPAAFLSLASVMVIDVVGMERFPAAIGKMYFFMAFGNVIGPPISGWFEDMTGTWVWSFRFAGILSLIAGLLVLLKPLVIRCCCCNNSDAIDENYEIEMEERVAIVVKD